MELMQDPRQFVYEISDSGGITMHCKLSSHLWAGHNMAHRLHCCLRFGTGARFRAQYTVFTPKRKTNPCISSKAYSYHRVKTGNAVIFYPLLLSQSKRFKSSALNRQYTLSPLLRMLGLEVFLSHWKSCMAVLRPTSWRVSSAKSTQWAWERELVM